MSSQAVREREAHIAFSRFGLGAKRGQFQSILSDPRGAVRAELTRPRDAILSSRALPSHIDACRASSNQTRSQSIYVNEVRARLNKSRIPTVGFVERLVMFWSNHFYVSARSGGVARSAVGEMERNRIRRHVLGNIRQLATGCLNHPAMIHYLTNGMSVGPTSAFGAQSGRNLNENLGRELLELHTVGVSAGFSQDDVNNASKILTGWSYVAPWQAQSSWQGGTPQNLGRFIFRRSWQEPGSHTVLGRSYGQAGISKGNALIADLAVNPKTAQHIAYKLVKHFITDTPTPSMVVPVARAFIRSDGDLPTTYRALLSLPAAWQMPLTKLRTPYEHFVAQGRAIGLAWTVDDARLVLSALGALSNRPWEWLAPDGFPDDTQFWMQPHGIYTRVAATQTLLRRVLGRRPERSTVISIAEGIFGPSLSRTTASELRNTSNRLHGLTCLLVSPEMMKR